MSGAPPAARGPISAAALAALSRSRSAAASSAQFQAPYVAPPAAPPAPLPLDSLVLTKAPAAAKAVTMVAPAPAPSPAPAPAPAPVPVAAAPPSSALRVSTAPPPPPTSPSTASSSSSCPSPSTAFWSGHQPQSKPALPSIRGPRPAYSPRRDIGRTSFARLCWAYHTIDAQLIRDVVHSTRELYGEVLGDAADEEEDDDHHQQQQRHGASSYAAAAGGTGGGARAHAANPSSSSPAAAAADGARGRLALPLVSRTAFEAIVASTLFSFLEDDCARAHAFNIDGTERPPAVAAALEEGDIDAALEAWTHQAQSLQEMRRGKMKGGEAAVAGAAGAASSSARDHLHDGGAARILSVGPAIGSVAALRSRMADGDSPIDTELGIPLQRAKGKGGAGRGGGADRDHRDRGDWEEQGDSPPTYTPWSPLSPPSVAPIPKGVVAFTFPSARDTASAALAPSSSSLSSSSATPTPALPSGPWSGGDFLPASSSFASSSTSTSIASQHGAGTPTTSSFSSTSSSSSSASLSYRGLSSAAYDLALSIECSCAGPSASSTRPHTNRCMQSWYDAARQRVDELARRRSELFARAREIHNRRGGSGLGRGVYSAAAGAYADQGHALSRAMEAANEVASHALYLLQNPSILAAASGSAGGGGGGGSARGTAGIASSSFSSSSEPLVVDLHGQHAEEAVNLLCDHVFPSAIASRGHTHTIVLHLVTGRGNHSSTVGKGRMRDRVGVFLESERLRGRAASVIIGDAPRTFVVERVQTLDGGAGFAVTLSGRKV
jgi:hypothetical protein